MLKEKAIAAGAKHQVSSPMTLKRILLGALAIIAVLGAAYALLSMLTQGMLGGASPAEVWWDRFYAWWIDFLAAGFLIMLAVFLWRKARDSASPWSDHHAKKRVLLFPLGHVFLTSALYFADFASYLFEHSRSSNEPMPAALYAAISVASAIIAIKIFWSLRKRSSISKQAVQ